MIFSEPPPPVLANYRLVAAIGTGGMARVYLAMSRKESGFTKLFVLKVLRKELDSEGEFLEMFNSEAQLAARINHPNVVQTYEVAEDAGQHFMAMEYLEGHALNTIVARVGRDAMPLELGLRILSDALEGLHYAHELTDYDGTPLQIIHRDVSPQNLFVTYTGHTKVLDFGIAKVRGSTHTKTGVIKGKLAYMAPEQAAAKPLDRRADIFAVGVMLWEVLARRKLVSTRTDEISVLTCRINGKDPKIREIAPDVPSALADICDKAMALEPDERFATAAEMRDAIEAYLRQGPPVGARHVAAFLETYFDEDRSRMRRLLDEQIKGAEVSKPILHLAAQSTVTPLLADAATLMASAPGSGRSWLRMLTVAAGGLVLLLGARFMILPARDQGNANGAGASERTAETTATNLHAPEAAKHAAVAPKHAAPIADSNPVVPSEEGAPEDGGDAAVRQPTSTSQDASLPAHPSSAPARAPGHNLGSKPEDVATLPKAAAAPSKGPPVAGAAATSPKPAQRPLDEKDPYE